MTNYSNSRLNCFDECPLKYKYQYIDKIKVNEIRVEYVLGTVVHEALDELYKNIQFENYLTLEAVLDAYEQRWKENIAGEKIVINKTNLSLDNYHDLGRRHLTYYYNKNKPFFKEVLLESETNRFLRLNNKDKYHIKIDRLVRISDEEYHVHDYKTTNKLWRDNFIEKERQLSMYCLWVYHKFPKAKRIVMRFHFLAFQEELSAIKPISELERIKQEIIRLIEKIEATKEFKPKKSSLCDWCQYQKMCPKFKEQPTPSIDPKLN